MKRWILEVGNTRAKWACFESVPSGNSLAIDPATVKTCSAGEADMAATWRQDLAPDDRVMVTGSGDLSSWIPTFPAAWVLRPGDSTPLVTDVRHQHTLGLDRVANAWAVLQGTCTDADPTGAWMIVDAGTCVTVDVVARGRHLGGTISPGVHMRLEAMSRGTARLPLPSMEEAPKHLNDARAVGLHTDEALVGGALGGLSAEIFGKWTALRQEVPNLGVVLTGGDAERLELRDIRPKFADAHLTLKGYHALFTHAHPSP
jgi:pantothenate kinase type III